MQGNKSGLPRLVTVLMPWNHKPCKENNVVQMQTKMRNKRAMFVFSMSSKSYSCSVSFDILLKRSSWFKLKTKCGVSFLTHKPRVNWQTKPQAHKRTNLIAFDIKAFQEMRSAFLLW